MVTAAFYFATTEDQATLLDYLGEPDKATLHPWPVVRTPLEVLSREAALAGPQVLVVNRDLGPSVPIRLGDGAMDGPTRAGLFNRLNWDRLRPSLDEALVDSNASPVLFWEPAEISKEVLGVSKLGSQADSMAAISVEWASQDRSLRPLSGASLKSLPSASGAWSERSVIRPVPAHSRTASIPATAANLSSKPDDTATATPLPSRSRNLNCDCASTNNSKRPAMVFPLQTGSTPPDSPR